MNSAANLSIVTGIVPVALDILGLGALVWLLVGRRRHMTRWVPLAAAVTALLMGAFWYLAEQVWNLWGEPLPIRDYVFAGFGLLAVLVMVPKIIAERRWWRRLVAVPAAAVVVLASAGLVNQSFDYFPTAGSLFGNTGITIETLGQFRAQTGSQPEGYGVPDAPGTIGFSWIPPRNMPEHGDMLNVYIPGTHSHMVSSSAYVYLPPAYVADPHLDLPVLVLIHGVPGGTIDWLRGGQIGQFMDDYASAHEGLAPIVVMPDAGAKWSAYPPVCVNSKMGQAATYLTKDVPAWVKSTFGVGTLSSRQWAIGGFSYGGTCAMTLAMNHPEVYPTFIDSSGESQPTIRQGYAVMLEKYFGNNVAAYRRQNALDVMKTRHYPGVAGIVTVGADDGTYRPQGIEVYEAMRRAGIDVRLQEAPGGHAWPAWRYGVYHNMDWLMQRLGVGG